MSAQVISDNQIIRLILGFKVRYLRQRAGLSYQELAEKTKLSTSYLSDIEKGKRYPKPDKIAILATAFGVDYNYMVSTNASKKLQPIIDLLNSKFFKLFPLKDFGISPAKLVALFTNTPDKINAFISTIFKIARNYQVGEKQFYLEALRSYQDMHDNYFPELEAAVKTFKTNYKIKGTVPYTFRFLAKQLKKLYGITTNKDGLSNNSILAHIRSYYNPKTKTLYLKKGLKSSQENFLLARELGFQFLNLKERPYETTIIEINSFEKLLNNYKASHFAAALLMDEFQIATDIRQMARKNTWHPNNIIQLLKKYNVTPETFLQRLTNILPHHFDINDLFFIRLSGSQDLKTFTMTKDLHLAQLHSPYNNGLNEHYCNRWVSITSIKALRLKKSDNKKDTIVVDAQISKYWNTDKAYFCISIANTNFQNPQKGVSVTLGLLINPHLKSIFYALTDPNLKQRLVHTTCERCGIIDCDARVASPVVIEAAEKEVAMIKALEVL